jgi:hypothetical protein
MYLQLAGPQPLDTAENPLAPGAPTYAYDAFYLGASQDIPLPEALYKTSPGGFVDALKKLKGLYQAFASGKKTEPAVVAARAASAAPTRPTTGVRRSSPIRPMGDPITLAAAAKLLSAAIPAIQAVLGTVSATLVNNKITNLFQQNAYNVQNLNRMNVRELSIQIQAIDQAIATTPRLNFVQVMALSQLRLVYQQRFDMISGVGALSALPGWVLPAALGVGAYLLIRRK